MTGTRLYPNATIAVSLRSAALCIAMALSIASPPVARLALATNDGNWAALPFPPPSPRVRHSAIYDPVRNRMVLFGGLAGSSLKNDVWELTFSGTPAWHQIHTAGVGPSPRSGHSAVYDPVRDRMIIYAGNGGSALGDVWTLSFSGTPAWTQLGPTGTPPANRFGHGAIYDPVRDRLVIWAGQGSAGYRNDVWALSLAGVPSWSQLLPTGGPPPARSRSTAIYDAVRDRMVTFGGKDAVTFYDDAWALSFSGSPAWTALAPSGTGPTARYGHSSIYDPVRDRMVLFGGFDGNDPLDGSVWTMSFAGSPAWGTLSPSGTPAQGSYDHSAIYDSNGDRMLLFGGTIDVPTNGLSVLSLSGGTSWVALAPTGGPPPPRTGHGAVYDPVRDRMLVIDGYGASGDFQDVWALTLNGLTWAKLQPTGQAPSARDGHVLVYDSVHDRVLMFGGIAGSNYVNDTWSLSLSGTPAWSQLSPNGSLPGPRYAAAGIYDPSQDRLVIFGGFDGNYFGDVWALSLSGTPSWTQLAPTGTPPAARYLHNAVRLKNLNQMLIFGGSDSSLFNDAWTMTLSGTPAWSQLSPTGTAPAARYQSTAIYDSTRQRVVIFGGFDGTTLQGDTWSLSFSGTPAWSMLSPTGLSPTPRYGHSAIYDVPRDRMLVYGGLDGTMRDDTWELAWNGITGIAELPADESQEAVRLRPAYPNPFHGSATIPIDLARSREGRLAIFDVRGRLVRQLAQGILPSGVTYVRWDGEDDQGDPVASGAYFYRIESGAVRLTRKIILLK